MSTAAKKMTAAHVKPVDKDCQFTPRPVIDFARNVFGRSVHLDPASSEVANQVVQAQWFFTEQQNCLDKDWTCINLFFNPPYSRGVIAPMIEKFLVEYKAGKIGEAIVLVNSSTTSGWYQALLAECNFFLLPSHRINFWSAEGLDEMSEAKRHEYQSYPSGGNRYDQTIFYFGRNRSRFCDLGASIGTVCHPLTKMVG